MKYKGRLVNVASCPVCRANAVIYQKDLAVSEYQFFCFSCGEAREKIDPSKYRDVYKDAMLSLVERLRYEKGNFPATASWRDIQISLLGMIDVRNIELFNLRKFFERMGGEESSQLNFYHLLKRVSDKQARR